MAKKGKLKRYARIEGIGEECPKGCGNMERRKRIIPPNNHSYFYRKWDYCPKCGHVQHYEHFKSWEWQEKEEIKSFFASI